MRLNCKRIHPDAALPRYSHGPAEDAAIDLFAARPAELPPHCATLVTTGIAIELPSGFEGQIRPRSGLAIKRGITVLNSPGTIDPGYRGEIAVILFNHSDQPYNISVGDRIAQLVIARYETVELCETELTDTTRGQRGFGSSGR